MKLNLVENFQFKKIRAIKIRADLLILTAAVSVTMITGCDRDNSSNRKMTGPQDGESKRAEHPNTRGKLESVTQVNARLHRSDLSGRIDQSSIDLLIKLAESDPGLALQVYISDPKNLGLVGFDRVAEVICRLHPDFVKEWLKDDHWRMIPDDTYRKMTMVMLMSNLTLVDPAAALEVLDVLPKDDGLYDSTMQNLFTQFGRKNANLALNEAKSRFSGKRLDFAIKTIARGQSYVNLEGALKTVELLSDKSDEDRTMASILGGVVRYGDYEKISNFISSTDNHLLGEILLADSDGELTGQLLKNDLDEIKRALDSMVVTESSRNLFTAYLASKVMKDTDAAFSFLAQIPDSPIKTDMVLSVFNSMSGKNMDIAIERLGPLIGEERLSALKGIALSAGSTSMENVISIAQKIDSSDQGSFIAEAIDDVCKRDFDSALKYVDSGKYLSNSTDVESRTKVIQTLSRNYASRNPEAAFKWIDSLDESSKPAAMGAYAMERGKVDPIGLSEQLSGMPHNETWRSGVRVLVSQLRSSDPEMAARWEKVLDGKK